MKSEKLLEAMTDIDSRVIWNAVHDEPQQHRTRRWSSLILIAAAILAAMALTAFAADDIANWFRSFFADLSQGGLSKSQIEYIDKNTSEIAQSQTQEGYTITVESAFTDGRSAYIKMILTAPEGTVLDAENYSPEDIGYVSNEDGAVIPFDSGWGLITDNDDRENTVGMLCTIYNAAQFQKAGKWVFKIENLNATYSRNAGRDDYEMWHETVAEGLWIFEIELKDAMNEEIELISEPIPCRIDIGLGDLDGNKVEQYVGVTITSFKLRAMGAEMTYEFDEYVYAAGEFDDIYIVMKDGRQILMKTKTCAIGSNTFLFLEPVIFSEIDHILLPGGTKLPLPEN